MNSIYTTSKTCPRTSVKPRRTYVVHENNHENFFSGPFPLQTIITKDLCHRNKYLSENHQEREKHVNQAASISHQASMFIPVRCQDNQ